MYGIVTIEWFGYAQYKEKQVFYAKNCGQAKVKEDNF